MKPVITPSGEDYLEAILVLHKKMGMVRSVDVARHMEVSKAQRLPCGKYTAKTAAFLRWTKITFSI